jgi:long-chain acyl-CoA synthetase
MKSVTDLPGKWPKGVPAELSGYDKPLYSFLDEAAKKYPNQTFTIFQGAARSYAQVKEAAEKVAGFLRDLGVGEGDKVAVFLPNIPQFPEVFFGVSKSGAVCVTCNPLYTADELNFQLKDCEAKVVFCMDHPEFYPTTVKAVESTGIEHVIICNVKSYLPKIKGIIGGLLGKIPKAEGHVTGHLFFDDLMKTARPLEKSPDINPAEDLALILYTSGTTGKPKGACLTHSNLVFAVKNLDEWVRFPQETGGSAQRVNHGGAHCYLGILPWYHIFGLWTSMLWCCLGANKVICIPDPRNGTPPFTDALQSIVKHKVTIVAAVPTIFTALTNHPNIDQYDLGSIQACASGAAPLAPETLARFEKKTGAVIFEGYGMSECLPIGINPTSLEERKIGSVGFPCISTTVKILDIETGSNEMPQGKTGEISVYGPQVMKEYYKRPDANQSDFKNLDGDRYFLTGDIGYIDDEGYLIITDRKKDMILVGGFNVYPAEVEEMLISHPKVALSAVIGLPDEKKGEKVKAFVQLNPGEKAEESEIIEYCRQKMSGYKCPSEIEFRPEMHTSIVGKVIRRKFKEEEEQLKN